MIFSVNSDGKVLYQQNAHSVKFIAHIDHNFLTTLLCLTNPDRVNPQSVHLASAIMALTISFGFTINPTHATIEYGISADGDAADKLFLFYCLNDIHPSEYADIALGKKTKLS